jgi:hypothetical protein
MKCVRLFMSLLASLLTAGLITACSRQPVVTVINASAAPLESLTVSGNGFSERLGALAPGKTLSVVVSPKGETGLRLEIDVNGAHHAPPADGYLEGNSRYQVKAAVKPDFSVEVGSRL